MRQVLRAPHTLFILTTREYILRHAAQLHEELRHGNVEEHRYLLSLGHYGLLDRARIFLNHAYHSQEVPTLAARSLVEDDAYLRILGHDNYNPRTIAYITGLAGPGLKLERPEEYVSFAVAVLDDPARLWRQAFRHEIGDSERALLLAVASAGGEIAEADLRDLYDALAPALGAEAGEEAYEDALHSLHDSMLRTRQEVGRVFVAGRDPSVDDYLLTHVSGHPQHAQALVESAVAFEQVQWLIRQADVDRMPDMTQPLAAAVKRTYAADPIAWHSVFWEGDAEPTLTHEDVNLPRRLLNIHGFMQRAPDLEGPLRAWWQERLVAMLESLGDQHHNQRRELLLLVKTVRGSISATERGPQALADFMSQALYFDQRWSALIELHELWPELFDSDAWVELRDRCESWAVDGLTDVYERRDVEEVDEIVIVAERMGISLDESLIDEARDQVAELRGYRDDDREYEPPDEPDEPPTPSDADRRRVREEFVRFAEEAVRLVPRTPNGFRLVTSRRSAP